MTILKQLRITFTVVIVSLIQTTVGFADNQFIFTPGYYIGAEFGQGIHNWGTEEGAFTSQLHYSSVNKGIEIIYDGHGYWTLDFAAPNNAPLAVGVYENATRWPFQSSVLPGLDISGDGRGCNELSGNFEVLEVEYSQDNQSLVRFAANFTQHCENSPAPLEGSIYYNSTISPTPTPTPTPTPGGTGDCNQANIKRGTVEATVSLSGTSVLDSNNAVIGTRLSTGTSKKVKINGVSFTATKRGSVLTVKGVKGSLKAQKTFSFIGDVFVIDGNTTLNGVYWVTNTGIVNLAKFAVSHGVAKVSASKVGTEVTGCN